MIATYTGTCHYCHRPMSYRRPWHSECWLAAQARLNPRTRNLDDPACHVRACQRPATTYTKLLAYWERSCHLHKDRGYSLERSHTYIAGLLDGRKP